MRKQITLYDDQYAFYKELKSEKLLIAFVEYMFEDIEPQWFNSLEQTIRNSLVVRMDNLKKKSDAWSKSHGWWRPKKTTEKTTQRQSKKQHKNNRKTTQKQQVKVEDKDKVKDISDTIVSDVNSNELTDINISDTNILNIIQTWQKKKKFWNEEVNECLEMIEVVNWWAMDGTKPKNRQFAYNLIWKIKEMPTVSQWKITWQQVLSMIIELNKDDKYYACKITSPENIYRNFGTLCSSARTKIQEQRKKQEWVF